MIDGVNRDYQVVVPRDAVAGVGADYVDAVLDNTIALLATLTTTADLIAGLVVRPFGRRSLARRRTPRRAAMRAAS